MRLPNEAAILEVAIFHQMVRDARKPHLEYLFLALQGGLAFGAKLVDVGDYLSRVLPSGYGFSGGYCPPYDATDLAFFSLLFNFTIQDGSDNYCHVHFERRYDRAQIMAYLKLTWEASALPK